MPKKASIIKILKYKNQILLMKKIMDEILEPTEEEKKYKEKHKKDMEFPKSFQDKEGSASIWEWHEQNFDRLAKNLSVLADYYDEKSSLKDCEEAWDEFDRNVNGFFEGIQEKVHDLYAIGDGEFDALTNPRARRMVRIADTITDLEGLKEALYERENINEIQENAYSISVKKKTYLQVKKEFADNYHGIKLQQKRNETSEILKTMHLLTERNQQLEKLIRENEGKIVTSHVNQRELSEKLIKLTQKKLEFDTSRQKVLKEVSTIKAYKAFHKLSKEIRELEEQLDIIKEEKNFLEENKRELKIRREKLWKELIEKKDPLALKYKDINSDEEILEAIAIDDELLNKHTKLAIAALDERAARNAYSSQYKDRDIAIEDLEVKIGRLQMQLDIHRNIINNNDLPDLENATDGELSIAQRTLREMEEDLSVKRLEEEIEVTKINIQNAKEDSNKKEEQIKKAKQEIKNNDNRFEQLKKAQGEHSETIDKAARAVYHYNQLQRSKQEFVDSMKDFNFGEKTAGRLIHKAKTYNLQEGTRFLHKNSPEFTKMDQALDEVKKCNPGNRGELKNKLKALEQAAREYREKKLKDGGFNTGMRNTRLTKAQNLITMCQLGIQELSAVSEKKEKAMIEYKEEVDRSLQKRANKDSKNKVSDLLKVDDKLDRAHEKADKIVEKLEKVDKKIDELQELAKDNDDFSM